MLTYVSHQEIVERGLDAERTTPAQALVQPGAESASWSMTVIHQMIPLPASRRMQRSLMGLIVSSHRAFSVVKPSAELNV